MVLIFLIFILPSIVALPGAGKVKNRNIKTFIFGTVTLHEKLLFHMAYFYFFEKTIFRYSYFFNIYITGIRLHNLILCSTVLIFFMFISLYIVALPGASEVNNRKYQNSLFRQEC